MSSNDDDSIDPDNLPDGLRMMERLEANLGNPNRLNKGEPNGIPENFIRGPGNELFPAPPEYGGHVRAMFPLSDIPANWGMWNCQHCNLMPCITVEYNAAVSKAITNDLSRTDEAELFTILSKSFRESTEKQCGKQFMMMLMPTENQLPECAMEYCVLKAQKYSGKPNSTRSEPEPFNVVPLNWKGPTRAYKENGTSYVVPVSFEGEFEDWSDNEDEVSKPKAKKRKKKHNSKRNTMTPMLDDPQFVGFARGHLGFYGSMYDREEYEKDPNFLLDYLRLHYHKLLGLYHTSYNH